MIQGVVNRFEAIHDRREAEIHGRGANRKLDGKWYVTRTIISDDGQETRENGAQLCQRFFTGYGYDRSEIGVTNERSSSFLIEFTRFPLNNSGAKGARERAEWNIIERRGAPFPAMEGHRTKLGSFYTSSLAECGAWVERWFTRSGRIRRDRDAADDAR